MATQADLDALNAAIFSGKRRVRLGQREVEYQSIEQMRAAKELLMIELNRSAGLKRPKAFRTRTNKGL